MEVTIIFHLTAFLSVTTYKNKLIFLYIKIRRCKYYTLNTMYNVYKTS